FLLSAPSSFLRPRYPPYFPYTTLFRSIVFSIPQAGTGKPPAPGSAGVRRRIGPKEDGSQGGGPGDAPGGQRAPPPLLHRLRGGEDRKSTRLNSSHVKISYAVFCLKKKK